MPDPQSQIATGESETLEVTIPGKPRSHRQRYRITPAGARLLAEE